MRKLLIVLCGLALLAALLIWATVSDGPDPAPPVETPKAQAKTRDRQGASTRRKNRRGEKPPRGVPGEAPPTAPPTPEPALRPLEGRVIDADGSPVVRALVWGGSLEARRPVFTGATGGFRLTLPIGTVEVQARAAEGGLVRREVTVEAGDGPITLPDLVLGPGLTIQGTVVDEGGRPLQAVRVRAMADAGDPTEMMTGGRRYMIGMADVLTGRDGRFEMTGLSEGTYKVWLDLLLHPGGDSVRADPEAHEHVSAGGDRIEFRLVGRSEVSGEVVDAAGGAPIVRFTVNGVAVDDAAGWFKAPIGEKGELVVAARGYLAATKSGLVLGEGEAAGGLRIELERDPDTGTLVVEVVDGDGVPVSGYTASGGGPEFRSWSETCAADDGVLRVAGLRTGKHRFWVNGEGFATVEADVEVPQGGEVRHKVVTARGGAVHVRILDAAGEPLRYVKIAVLDPEGTLLPFRWIYDRVQGTSITVKEWWGAGPHNLSEAEGRVTGLAAGSYRLRIGEGDGAREVEIEVPESGEVRREIGP